MSARTPKAPKVEIPFLLSEAVKTGRAILFLGAGASKECKNAKGQMPPDGDGLRDMLASKFFGKAMPKRTLQYVAELAIQSGAGAPLVFEAVNTALEGYATSEAHRLVSDFNWRAIATTNYDMFLEDAYGDASRRRQTLISFVKDNQPVDEMMRRSLNPVQYLKLHGSLDHRLDKEIPLVLAWQQYSSHSFNRTRLFSRLADLSHECPLVFVGYGMGDDHIRDLVLRLETASRPRWFMVDPGAEPEDVAYWASRNCEVITARFGDFMNALDAALPKLLRFLSPHKGSVDFPLRRFYASPSEESDALRASFTKDIALIHSSIAFQEQTAERFYSGYDTGWGGIINRYDANRKVTGDLLFKALAENETPDGPVLIVLRGPAGAGKTIALKRAAFDAAIVSEALVIWFEDVGQLRPDIFSEIAELTRKIIYLFVDQVAIHVDKLSIFLRAAKVKRLPIVIVGAEREADWTTYCGRLEDEVIPQFMRVGMLSSREVEDLLDLLARHDCLGDLKTKSRQEQVEAFMSAEQADRQLLVALHILTRGIPFERIVLNEYESVNPEQARRLYLDIATMHQFGVTVRAGAIKRVSGIDFEQYQDRFFAPLKDMVLIGKDPYTGDHAYRTRHARVAELVFRQVCADDQAKADQFMRLIKGLDAGYSSDARTLEGIIRGRTLAEEISDVDLGRRIYATAVVAAPEQAYVNQQWAIFESTHVHGDMLEAENLAEEAREAEPKNRTFIHTQAEVARKRANHEGSPVLKDQLRRKARAFLSEMPVGDRFAISSRCKLLVDEVSDISASIPDEEHAAEEQFFAQKLREAEQALTQAQQAFPEDPEMVEIEARLWREVGNKGKALRALERAWKKVPRGSGTAVRLSKIYGNNGQAKEQRDVLREALKRDPDDKGVHYAMGLHLIEHEPHEVSAIRAHLGQSFASSDNNFEARYMLAQFLFLTGDPNGAEEIFSELRRRAPEAFRPYASRVDNVITSRLPEYNGSIEIIRDGYARIRAGAYSHPVFAPRSAFLNCELDELSIGQAVTFRLRFNRQGPVAVSINPKSYKLVAA
jgi:tetratricopeptide (TPR) repeat protein